MSLPKILNCFDRFKTYLDKEINTRVSSDYERYAKKYIKFCLENRLSMEIRPEEAVYKFLKSLQINNGRPGSIILYRRGIYYLYQLATVNPNPTEHWKCATIEQMGHDIPNKSPLVATAIPSIPGLTSQVPRNPLQEMRKQIVSTNPLVGKESEKIPPAPVNIFMTSDLSPEFLKRFDEFCKGRPNYSEKFKNYLFPFKSINPAVKVNQELLNKRLASHFKNEEDMRKRPFYERLQLCFERLKEFLGPAFDKTLPSSTFRDLFLLKKAQQASEDSYPVITRSMVQLQTYSSRLARTKPLNNTLKNTQNIVAPLKVVKPTPQEDVHFIDLTKEDDEMEDTPGDQDMRDNEDLDLMESSIDIEKVNAAESKLTKATADRIRTDRKEISGKITPSKQPPSLTGTPKRLFPQPPNMQESQIQQIKQKQQSHRMPQHSSPQKQPVDARKMPPIQPEVPQMQPNPQVYERPSLPLQQIITDDLSPTKFQDSPSINASVRSESEDALTLKWKAINKLLEQGKTEFAMKLIEKLEMQGGNGS